MAYEEALTFNKRSVVAGADLSAKQYYGVTSFSGNTVNVAATGKAIAGILQDKPTSGQAGCIAYAGVTKAAIAASQTITAGVTMLEVGSGGTLIANSSGIIVARALGTLDGTIAAVTYMAVELLPSNAAMV